jgi:prepilin-type processing-associated H-X9-DG protein
LFLNSAVGFSDIRDGTSNTLLFGERPPSPDNWFGWWYAGYGQQDSGVPDMLLGVRERNIGYDQFSACTETLGEFRKGTLDNFCDTLHYWSCHLGGAYFAFADGRVDFLTYESNDILPLLATRSQGD